MASRPSVTARCLRIQLDEYEAGRLECHDSVRNQYRWRFGEPLSGGAAFRHGSFRVAGRPTAGRKVNTKAFGRDFTRASPLSEGELLALGRAFVNHGLLWTLPPRSRFQRLGGLVHW